MSSSNNIDGLVSIIIPNYNHEKYLEERIQSILNQTYQNFEIIILDDCSTDNSKIIIEKYRNNPKFKHIIYNQQNSGSTFKQWDKGFQLASGEFIWIAESDDVAALDFLYKLISKFKQYPSAVIAVSGINFIDSNNQPVNKISPINNITKEFWSSKEFINKYLLENNAIYNASSVLFKKSIIKDINKDYTSYKSAGDYLLWIEIIKKGPIITLNEKLDFFRIVCNSVTNNAMKTELNAKEIKSIFEKLIKYKFINKTHKHLIIGKKIVNYRKNTYLNNTIKKRCIKIWVPNKLEAFCDVLFYQFYKKINQLL